MKPIKIVSGGQTGADRAALDWAIEHGMEHGGWCPKGREAEDGPIAARYKLQETPTSDYEERTEWNVRDSDGTVIFSVGEKLSEGSLLTLVVAISEDKPCIHLSAATNEDAAQSLRQFIDHYDIRVLNVAGSRAAKEPKAGGFVTATLQRLFNPALIYVVKPGDLAEVLKLFLETEIESICIVRTFSDPVEAVQSFASEKHKPDLLITGFMLKNMHGTELLQECKRLNPRLKVLMLAETPQAHIEKVLEGLPFKPDAYVKVGADTWDHFLPTTRKLLRRV